MQVKLKNKTRKFRELIYFISLILIYSIYLSCNDYPEVSSPSENIDSLEMLKNGFDSLLKLNNSSNTLLNSNSDINTAPKYFNDTVCSASKINLKAGYITYPFILETERMGSQEQEIFITPHIKNIYSLSIDKQEKIKPVLKPSAQYIYSRIINPFGLFYLKYNFNKTYYRELKNKYKADEKSVN